LKLQGKLQGAALLISAFLASAPCRAQGLAPRAYVITPRGSNAIILTYSLKAGDIAFDSTIPISDAAAQVHLPVLSYYLGFGLFGRSANFTATLPYGVASFSGKVMVGTEQERSGSLYRSGLADSTYRFSVNLIGGPAMRIDEFRSWRQKTVVGTSIIVVAPTGQYDRVRLINQSSNRWALKPEIGLSQRWRKWILDAYGAVWFFTANKHYYTGDVVQTQLPVGVVETHLSYDVKQRLWFSADANFWYGGATSWNGAGNANTTQTSSRVGGTVSIPLDKHQSLKFSYSASDYFRVGGNYQSVSAAWQYAWLPSPK
jgi:Putative MetA-pathway of phenol degradation